VSRGGFASLLCVAATTLVLGQTQAGALLTAGFRVVPDTSPYPGQVLVELANMRWTENCARVSYSLNTTIDPIPDHNGEIAMSLAEARIALQAAMRSWAEIPTSYVEQHIDGVIPNPGIARLDFINEVTFRSGHLGFGPTVTGLSRSFYVGIEFVAADGLDYDGDGDADFSSKARTCRDVDGDGDIEHPAGTVPAGTILDNDVYFFPQHTRYDDVAANPVDQFFGPFEDRTDLEGVATHEFGHAFGLAHSMVLDTDRDDGSGVSMSTWYQWDGALSLRAPHSDDIAWASWLYPEGSRRSGIAALQKGDIAFDRAYSLIEGEVRDAFDNPVIGAQPFARGLRDEMVTNAISGAFRLSFDPVSRTLHSLPFALAIPHGKYTLPVPRGVYRVGLESADGFPVFSGAQNNLEEIGGLIGQVGFVEEYWGGPFEGSREWDLNVAWPVIALHDRGGVDFELDPAWYLLGTGEAGPEEADFSFAARGEILAVRIPTEQLLALDEGRGIFIQAALFGTTPLIEEESGFLDMAMITTGEVRPDGSVRIDLRNPLVKEKDILIETWELTPLHVSNPGKLGDYVTRKLAGSGKDLFVVAKFPNVEHPLIPGFNIGPTGQIVRYSTPSQPGLGNTYYSRDGGATYTRWTSDAYFGLTAGAR
jgi:hypothetical protein